jgi:selenocysteine insertion sequence-binding protein 2
LNEDDLEDEDCLNESLGDIRMLAAQYGIVGSVRAEVSVEQRNVRVLYLEGHQAARHAAQKFDGMMLGGITLSASVVFPTDNVMNDDDKDMPMQEIPATTAPSPPIYSGDGIIPEQYAACKRVPKILNAGIPRSYASEIDDERAMTLITEMLGELMRLQERSKDDKNARARRRIVMGLREVTRGIRTRKVKMVVMADNLDEYGAIDSKLQEILELARVGELPVLYELNKRKLGKALGKSIKVLVVGIQNANGAHDQFKKLKKMLGFTLSAELVIMFPIIKRGC